MRLGGVRPPVSYDACRRRPCADAEHSCCSRGLITGERADHAGRPASAHRDVLAAAERLNEFGAHAVRPIRLSRSQIPQRFTSVLLQVAGGRGRKGQKIPHVVVKDLAAAGDEIATPEVRAWTRAPAGLLLVTFSPQAYLQRGTVPPLRAT